MNFESPAIKELLYLYAARKDQIKKRLLEFKEVYAKPDEGIFAELCYCICTANYRADICMEIQKKLQEENLLLYGNVEELRTRLKNIGYRYPNRAAYIIKTREYLKKEFNFKIKEKIDSFQDIKKAREWMAENRNIMGIGFKEASHFLRNIGRGKNLAILDRHILRNLKNLGVIHEAPKHLTKKMYLEIEEKMEIFSDNLGFPVEELDLLLWSRDTGKILK